jgi:hypothetical protein
MPLFGKVRAHVNAVAGNPADEAAIRAPGAISMKRMTKQRRCAAKRFRGMT